MNEVASVDKAPSSSRLFPSLGGKARSKGVGEDFIFFGDIHGKVMRLLSALWLPLIKQQPADQQVSGGKETGLIVKVLEVIEAAS